MKKILFICNLFCATQVLHGADIQTGMIKIFKEKGVLHCNPEPDCCIPGPPGKDGKKGERGERGRRGEQVFRVSVVHF